MVRGESQETQNQARRPSVGARKLQELLEASATSARTGPLHSACPGPTPLSCQSGSGPHSGSVLWEEDSLLSETKPRGRVWGPGVSPACSPGYV